MNPLPRLLAAAAVCLLPFGAAAVQVTVQPRVVIDADVVRLGDLFRGVDGPAAGVTVAAAPPLGGELQLRASELAQLAKQQGIDWEPSTTLRMIVVQRAAQQIPEARIRKALVEAIRQRTGDDEVAIDVGSRDLSLYAPPTGLPRITVESLYLDAAGGRFEATVSGGADAASPRLKVLGRMVAMRQVPVLARDIPAGEPIRPADIVWSTVPRDRMDRLSISDPAEIVGQAPRRPLRAGDPLKARDLVEPVVVAKGTTVTLSLSAPGIELTVSARALENGADGATISVMNLQSKRTVQGVVVGPQHVRVAARTFLIQADASAVTR